MFVGWYTKKSGGTKVTTGTKVKTKVTYYAKWKKSLSGNDEKLLGKWRVIGYYPSLGGTVYIYYSFDENRRFSFQTTSPFQTIKIGNYTVSNGKITFTNVKWSHGGKTENYPDTVVEYKFAKDSDGTVMLQIPWLDYPEKNYLTYNGFYANFIKA